MDFALAFLIFIVLAVVSFLIKGSRQRYRDPGQAADARNIEEFGQPAKSLYTSTELFTLHHRIEVTDGNEKMVYRAETHLS